MNCMSYMMDLQSTFLYNVVCNGGELLQPHCGHCCIVAELQRN